MRKAIGFRRIKNGAMFYFIHGRVDWTHEREWRCPNDADLAKIGFYVIVWSADEASQVAQLNTPLKNNILGVLPMEHLNEML